MSCVSEKRWQQFRVSMRLDLNVDILRLSLSLTPNQRRLGKGSRDQIENNIKDWEKDSTKRVDTSFDTKSVAWINRMRGRAEILSYQQVQRLKGGSVAKRRYRRLSLSISKKILSNIWKDNIKAKKYWLLWFNKVIMVISFWALSDLKVAKKLDERTRKNLHQGR